MQTRDLHKLFPRLAMLEFLTGTATPQQAQQIMYQSLSAERRAGVRGCWTYSLPIHEGMLRAYSKFCAAHRLEPLKFP